MKIQLDFISFRLMASNMQVSSRHFLHILHLSSLSVTVTPSSFSSLSLMLSSRLGYTFHRQQHGQQWQMVKSPFPGLTLIQTVSILFLPIMWLNPAASARSICSKASSTVARCPICLGIFLAVGPKKIHPMSFG